MVKKDIFKFRVVLEKEKFSRRNINIVDQCHHNGILMSKISVDLNVTSRLKTQPHFKMVFLSQIRGFYKNIGTHGPSERPAYSKSND